MCFCLFKTSAERVTFIRATSVIAVIMSHVMEVGGLKRALTMREKKGGGKSDERTVIKGEGDRGRGLFDQCAQRKRLVPYHG